MTTAAATTIIVTRTSNKQTQKLNAIYFYWTLVSQLVRSQESPNWYQQQSISIFPLSLSLRLFDHHKRSASAHSNAIPTRIRSLKTTYCTTVHAVYNSSLVLCSSIRAPPHTNTNTNIATHTHTHINTNTNKISLSLAQLGSLFLLLLFFVFYCSCSWSGAHKLNFVVFVVFIYIHTYTHTHILNYVMCLHVRVWMCVCRCLCAFK